MSLKVGDMIALVSGVCVPENTRVIPRNARGIVQEILYPEEVGRMLVYASFDGELVPLNRCDYRLV